jgi:hypothetical protein
VWRCGGAPALPGGKVTRIVIAWALSGTGGAGTDETTSNFGERSVGLSIWTSGD